MRELLPGDFFLSSLQGKPRRYIIAAQWIVADLSRYGHAGIYLGNGEVAEAMMPDGIEINPLKKYHGREFTYSQMSLTDSQREGIVQTARELAGTPYSYFGYLYIGLTYFQHCPKWVERRVSSSQKFLCSQFVDYCYMQNGVHLFDDGRLYLNIRPGDLARLITDH